MLAINIFVLFSQLFHRFCLCVHLLFMERCSQMSW